MVLKLLYIIDLKSAKITLSVYVAGGKFVCDVIDGKSVSFFLSVPGSSLNRAMFLAPGQSKRISHRLHWLLDLFRKISLHNVITSLIISRFGLGSS